jgi:UDP:flavonoid glycosyltransferase YjiC (YdhE family)
MCLVRVLFTTFPGKGHFHPLVPLAQAAVDRGDDVVFAASRRFGAWVSACGFQTVDAGLDIAELLARSATAYPGKLNAAHMFTTVAVPPMREDLLTLCARRRPDLIVHEEAEYAAPLVAAQLGIACVTHSWAAPARPEPEQELFRELMEPIWAAHHAGTPRLTGDVYLDACPPPFQSEAVAAIQGVRSLRPVAYDGPPTPPPPWLGTLATPAVYVTFGTVSQFSQVAALQYAIDASSQVAAGVVATSGPNAVDQLRAPSASVFVHEYLPQSQVLGVVDVVVSHGGAGTTLGALQHARPHVVIPQGGRSQLRNAERIEALGIGVHVTDERRDDLADIVRRTLGDERLAANAARVRDTFDALPAPALVVEQLARDFR